MRARESEEEMKKNAFLDTDTKVSLSLSLSLVQSFFATRRRVFFPPNIFSFSPEVGIVYV